MELWEILVPTRRNDGTPNRLRFHRVWDAKVREITGGLTVMPVAKGQWVSPEGKIFFDRMIPVRVAVDNEDQVRKIIALTLDHYDDQLAVMAYRISDNTFIVNRT